MKANKVTVFIYAECLHVDGVPALVQEAISCIGREAASGIITKEDGDTVKWETTLTPVEF